jgi:hypothetical protein
VERRRGIKRIRRHFGQSKRTLAGSARVVVEEEGLFLSPVDCSNDASLSRRRVEELRTPQPRHRNVNSQRIKMQNSRLNPRFVLLFEKSQRGSPRLRFPTELPEGGIVEGVKPNRARKSSWARRGGPFGCWMFHEERDMSFVQAAPSFAWRGRGSVLPWLSCLTGYHTS